jgi:hypothetical protein
MIPLIDISPALSIIPFIHHSFTFITQTPTLWFHYHHSYSRYSIQKNGQLCPIVARPWFFMAFFCDVVAPIAYSIISTIGNIFH